MHCSSMSSLRAHFSALLLTPICLLLCTPYLFDTLSGMWVAIVATIRQFRPVIGDLALLLLVPYLVWVSYASALTFWIWRNNPTRTGRVSG
jgi:tryptophan-rich sensory protein